MHVVHGEPEEVMEPRAGGIVKVPPLILVPEGAVVIVST